MTHKPETVEEALEIIEDLKADNAKLRRQKRELKSELEEVSDAAQDTKELQTKVSELEAKLKETEDYKTKYQELEGKYTEISKEAAKVERINKLTPIFKELNVTDEKALTLALEKVGEEVEEEKFSEVAKGIVEEFPFLASKPTKSIPDTGTANEGKAKLPENTQSKLAEGIKEAIAN